MSVTVKRVPNGYGFGYDLILYTTKGRLFYMGQEAKVQARILGWDYRDPRSEFGRLAEECHLPKKPHTEKSATRCMEVLMRAYAREILAALEITEKDLNKLESWELHVGGG